MCLSVDIAFGESVSISTYYPSPYGSYQTLETNTLQGAAGTGDLALAPAGGSVGIRNGASSPTALLDIGNSTLASNAIINVNAQAARQTGINFQSAGTSLWSMYRPADSTDLRFWDGTSDRITFVNGGSVGIGVLVPQAPLDVAGELRIGSTGLNCDGTKAGLMRYSGGNMEYCDGTSWAAMGGAPNFDAMYRNDSVYSTGQGTKSVYCNAGDYRVFCAPSSFTDDGKNRVISFPIELLSPNGCSLYTDEDTDPWRLSAFCVSP